MIENFPGPSDKIIPGKPREKACTADKLSVILQVMYDLPLLKGISDCLLRKAFVRMECLYLQKLVQESRHLTKKDRYQSSGCFLITQPLLCMIQKPLWPKPSHKIMQYETKLCTYISTENRQFHATLLVLAKKQWNVFFFFKLWIFIL